MGGPIQSPIIGYLEGSAFQKSRGSSPAVITRGGKTVWLSGHLATTDLEGNSIEYDIEAQTRTIFMLMDQTLERAGGRLKDLVTMTVFIIYPRHGDKFVEIRKQFFPNGHYPCSALIPVAQFARPGIMIEIQAVAVLPED